MKIGLVIDQLRNAGGIYQLLHLAQELQKKGHKITVFTINSKIIDIEPYLLKGLYIKSCKIDDPYELKPHSPIVGFILFYLYLFRSTIQLTKLVLNEDLDILNIHEWPMQWVGAFYKIREKIPMVWMCNDVWHIPGQKTYVDERILFRIGNKYLLPLLDRILTNPIDTIVVLDHRIQKIIEGFYGKKAIVVRSGIEIERYKKLHSKKTARSRLKIPQDAFIFLCLHSFFPHRRFEDAILAFEMLQRKSNKKMKLYIVGSDKFHTPYADSIRSLVKKRKLEDKIIIKMTYLSREELEYYLSACDTFIFPNNEQTWGIVVIEAMASKKICIVSTGAGVHEIIEDGKNGFLFKAKDINDLASTMQKVINSTISQREKISENAQTYVFKNLSWKNYAESMLKLFEKKVTTS